MSGASASGETVLISKFVVSVTNFAGFMTTFIQVPLQLRHLDVCRCTVNYIPVARRCYAWANIDITDAELGLTGYVMFRKDRIGRRGGGVILYVKESIQAYEINLKGKQVAMKLFGAKLFQEIQN